MEKVTINKEARLFGFACGGGFSCLGFDVLDRRARALAEELGAPWREKVGTRAAYAKYSALQEEARRVYEETGRRFDCGLTPQLRGLEGRRVEVVTTYGESRRFNVGMSTGWIPCHLEIARRGCMGGGAAEAVYKSVRVIR